MKQIPSCFATTPLVYAVGKEYQILVPVLEETVMWAVIDGKAFYDHANGVLRSGTTTHKMRVPQTLLDKAKHYEIHYRKVIDRKPYFGEAGEEEVYASDFRPVEKWPCRIYHIADAHNEVEKPVAAGKYFGEKLDLLILNGDIPNHSGELSYFDNIHRIVSEITEGEIPTVFSRGNHDLRGKYAENLVDHTPTDGGHSYFTFRVGEIWGIVLDCGEDKLDDMPNYGHMNCCAAFREEETAFLKHVIDNAKTEYEEEGVKVRLVIAHDPFTRKKVPPFDIEEERYTLWCKLLREQVKPQLMLCGHVHHNYISPVGSEFDTFGQPCTVVVGAEPQNLQKSTLPYIGSAFTLFPHKCEVAFTDNDGKIWEENTISF